MCLPRSAYQRPSLPPQRRAANARLRRQARPASRHLSAKSKASDRPQWFGWFQGKVTEREYLEEDDDQFPAAKFMTYRGAADVLLYDDHFAFVSPRSTPVDVKAWVPLTALTWKRVSIIWTTERAQGIKQPAPGEPSPSTWTLPQPEYCAQNAPSENTVLGDVNDNGSVSSSAVEQPVADAEDLLSEASSEESSIANKGTAADNVAADDDSEAVPWRSTVATHKTDNTVPLSLANDHFDGVNSPTVVPSEKPSVTGDTNDVWTTVASGGGVAAAYSDGVLLAPASDGGLVTHNDNDVVHAEEPAGRKVVNDRSTCPEKELAKGRGPFEGCASKESLPGDGCDHSANTASSGEHHMGMAVTLSSDLEQQQGFRHAPLLHSARVSNATVDEIDKGQHASRRGVAKGRTASAWLGREKKSNMAAKTNLALHSQLQAFRLRTKPPESWKCGPEGLCLKKGATWKLGGGENGRPPVV